MVPFDNCKKHKQVKLCCLFQMIMEKCTNQLCKFFLAVVISGLLMACYFFFHLFVGKENELCVSFTTVFSSLLGFVIAGYAIILSLGEHVLQALLKPLDKPASEDYKKVSAFEVLSATFAYCCLIVLITLIISSLCRDSVCLFCVTLFFATYSFVLVGDIIFHLYATSYYLSECNKQPDGNNLQV